MADKEKKKTCGLDVLVGGTLALAHSAATLRLMDRAGMYVLDHDYSSGYAYPELASAEGVALQLIMTAGTMALFLGGTYGTHKIREYLAKRRK